MNPRLPCTWSDDELERLPALSIMPGDPDPFCYVTRWGVAWQVGRNGGTLWLRGPIPRDDWRLR